MAGYNADPVMTISELAAHLRLAEPTVYRLVKSGQIPGRKVGGGWRFARKAIDEWFARPSDGLNKYETGD